MLKVKREMYHTAYISSLIIALRRMSSFLIAAVRATLAGLPPFLRRVEVFSAGACGTAVMVAM